MFDICIIEMIFVFGVIVWWIFFKEIVLFGWSGRYFKVVLVFFVICCYGMILLWCFM